MPVHGRRVNMPHMRRYTGREHTRADKAKNKVTLLYVFICIYVK